MTRIAEHRWKVSAAVIAAMAMARALPLLLRLEQAVLWMGLASAILMGGFGVLLISGDYMVVSGWAYQVASGAAAVPTPGNAVIVSGGLIVVLGIGGCRCGAFVSRDRVGKCHHPPSRTDC